MKTLGFYNGRIDELDRITVPMLDRACYFGDGIFEVAYTRNHKIYSLSEHIDRMYVSAGKLGIKIGKTKEELCALLEDLVLRVDDGEQLLYWQMQSVRFPGFPDIRTPMIHFGKSWQI